MRALDGILLKNYQRFAQEDTREVEVLFGNVQEHLHNGWCGVKISHVATSEHQFLKTEFQFQIRMKLGNLETNQMN